VDFHTSKKNVCGPQIARIRNQRGLSQPQLAAKCQLAGWDVSRDIIARIEGGVRWIGDMELAAIASVLEVSLETLYPENIRKFLK
jgi:transcriptional regulator with XRE-family HTH domain